MLMKIFRSATRRIRNLLGSDGKKTVALPFAEPAPKAVRAEQEPGTDESAGPRDRGVKRRRRKRKPDWDVSMFQVDPAAGKSRFHDFDLPDSVMHAVADLGFAYCTPIQAMALPTALQGRDIVGRAQTGTGKTAVFLISIFAKLLRETPDGASVAWPRALIIAPTRELVVQITKDGKSFAQHTPLQICPVFGGVDYRAQMKELQARRCDVVVATPGRLLDYLGKDVLRLDHCGIMVIDEADRMLDMGFIPDVRRIINRIPDKVRRQTMLFSATVTEEVRRLAGQWCREPVIIEIEPEEVAVESIDQIVYLVTTAEKYDVLYNLVRKNPERRILVFANQKNEARKLSERLKRNDIACELLTGDVPQQQRSQRLEEFREGKVPVLVATDVAGRGIHVDDVVYVINYTLPYEPEDYVHRIGRTGRAGAVGTSISFACEEGSFYLPQIEEYLGRKLDCVVPDETLLVPAPKQSKSAGKGEGRGSAAEAAVSKGPRRRPRRPR